MASPPQDEEGPPIVHKPIVPPRIRQLKSVVIRDENVPVKANRAATTLDQYAHYQQDHAHHRQSCGVGAAVVDDLRSDFESFGFDAPVPPRPQSSSGPKGGAAGFQRKTIVRSGPKIKVDKKSLVAARMKRFTSRRKSKAEGKPGLQNKILDGAENW